MKIVLHNGRAPAKSRKAPAKIVATSQRQSALLPKTLAEDVREMIVAARGQVAQVVSAGLTTLYWQIGKRIRLDVLKQKRAEYGARIVAALGRQLEAEFGRGFSEKTLRHMVRFAEVFPDSKIVSSLMRQLGWTHFFELHQAVRLARARLEAGKSPDAPIGIEN